MKTLKFKVINKDRLGLLLDISKILIAKGINVNSLEVVPDNMYFEIEGKTRINEQQLYQEIQGISGVIKCLHIELLPWEENNQRLQAVLDAISEGVLAVNTKAEITAVNPVVEKMFKLNKSELLGQNVVQVLSPDIPLLSCLKTGESYNHQEICINKGGQKFHYITSGRPIFDKNKQVVGVVTTLKDMTEVRQLVYSVIKPNMITFRDIIGQSERLKAVIQLAEIVAAGDSTILLRGESGTGKELFAKAIHMASTRRNKPFVPVNCAALPESLLESELFGYTEGAFTGAVKRGKQGLFEFANEGTIFLDEIAEVSPYLQAKLLRVLQEGTVRRVGSQEENEINVRVITATNRDLEQMVDKKEFRKDLYYRLNVIPIYLPPLSERRADISPLVDHFLKKMNLRFGKQVKTITQEALDKLYQHDWPGNVRELENVIERAVNLISGDLLTADLVMIDQNIQLLEPKQDQGTTLAELLNGVEKKILLEVLNKKGSIRKTAAALGVSHTTIMNKIKKYKLADGKEYNQWQ